MDAKSIGGGRIARFVSSNEVAVAFDAQRRRAHCASLNGVAKLATTIGRGFSACALELAIPVDYVFVFTAPGA